MTILVYRTETPAAEVAAGTAEDGGVTVDATPVAVGTPEAAVLALLDLVDLDFLNALKLTVIGRVQRRRVAAERPPVFQDHAN